MRTTIDLPESVYQHSEELARLKGYSIEQLIVQTLQCALETEPSLPTASKPLVFPLISSSRPGTLDLTDFNFDQNLG